MIQKNNKNRERTGVIGLGDRSLSELCNSHGNTSQCKRLRQVNGREHLDGLHRQVGRDNDGSWDEMISIMISAPHGKDEIQDFCTKA